jgi:hypothetical protein
MGAALSGGNSGIGLAMRTVALCALCATAAGAASEAARANHGASTLEVTRELDRNPFGGKTRLTARIDPAASTAQGAGSVLIRFEIASGPNALRGGEAQADDFSSPDFSCPVAPGESSCSQSYTDRRASPGEKTDRIVAWIDHDGTNAELEADVAEFYDAGAPPAEPGCDPPCGGKDYGAPGDVGDPDVTDVVLREWGQLGAGDTPLDGGLEDEDKNCRRDEQRLDGALAATTRQCSFGFLLPATQEMDEQSDYGAAWVQTTLDSRRGWCATRVQMDVALPDGASPIAFSPEAFRTKRPRVRSTVLNVGDPELSQIVSVLQSSYLVQPGRITVDPREGGQVVRLVWRGRSGADLALALGVAVSWPAAGTVPELPARTRVEYRLAPEC